MIYYVERFSVVCTDMTRHEVEYLAVDVDTGWSFQCV
jgi:hypothetical protein